MRIVLAALVVAVVCFFVFMLSHLTAKAHDWFPAECCSNQDCFPVKDTDLQLQPDGSYIVVHSGKRAVDVRESLDGRYYLCTGNATLDGEPKCVFEPDRGF